MSVKESNILQNQVNLRRKVKVGKKRGHKGM